MDGFDQDECACECDEAGEVRSGFSAAQSNSLEAYDLPDALFNASTSPVEHYRGSLWRILDVLFGDLRSGKLLSKWIGGLGRNPQALSATHGRCQASRHLWFVAGMRLKASTKEGYDLSGIFLSHSSRDKGLATKIACDLTLGGFDVWFDTWEVEIGDSLYERVFKASTIRHSWCFAYRQIR